MAFNRLRLAGLAFALLAVWPAAAETVTIDGVPHIRNSAEPSEGRQEIRLVEEWRAGGEEGELIFGALGRALSDEEGNVYLMDAQLCEVSVFSPSGELLRVLGGLGDGPGEIRGLGDIFFLPDGNLGLAQAYPGRVVALHRDGTPAQTFHFQSEETTDSNFGVLVTGKTLGGTFVLAGFTMRLAGALNTQTYYLSVCNAEGVEQHRFYEKESTIDYANYIAEERANDFVWSRWDLGPDGLLYAAPDRDAYAIEVHAPDGRLLRVIEREFTSYVRSPEERELARRYVEAVGRNHPVPPNACHALETDADISGLFVSPSGELWVTHSRSGRDLPAGAAARMDVFDSEGRYVRQVVLYGDFDSDRDTLQMVGANRFVVVVGAGAGYLNMMGVSAEGTDQEEAPVTEVICYSFAG